jgi:ABC-2 type transport system ATP-binding protein
MNALVELTELTKYYNSGRPAIDNMTLSLPRGKIIGLLGPNGSGKTTLIKMLNGLLVPTKGSIRIGGCTPGVETKKHVAYLPDRDFLDNSQKVSDFLDYYGDFYEDFDHPRAIEMLKSLQIDPNQRMKTLSKGTREKVQLILVMSRKADLFILDEPIAGVDPAARDYILRTIINNYNPGATVLFATHLIGDIEQVLDEVIFLQTGKLVLYNSVDAIREQQGKSVDAYFREVFAC